MATGPRQLELQHAPDGAEVGEAGQRVRMGESLEPLGSLGDRRGQPGAVHGEGGDVREQRQVGRVGGIRGGVVRERHGQGAERFLDAGPGDDQGQGDRRAGPGRCAIAAGRRQRVGRIGDRGDRRLLGGLVEPDREGELGIGPVRVLEADHRARRAEGRDCGADQGPDPVVEIGTAEGGRDAGGEGVERAGSIGLVGHEALLGRHGQDSRIGGERRRGSGHSAAASYTAPPRPRPPQDACAGRSAGASVAHIGVSILAA